jgi:hypothetical protein
MMQYYFPEDLNLHQYFCKNLKCSFQNITLIFFMCIHGNIKHLKAKINLQEVVSTSI